MCSALCNPVCGLCQTTRLSSWLVLQEKLFQGICNVSFFHSSKRNPFFLWSWVFLVRVCVPLELQNGRYHGVPHITCKASWQYWFGAETEQALASFPLYQSLQRPHDKDVNLGNHMKLHTVLLWNNQGLTMLSLFLNLQQNHSFYCLNTNTKHLKVPLQTANKVSYLIKRTFTFLLRLNL